MRSLQGRLGLGVGLTLVILLVAQWFVVGRLLHGLTEQYVASRLAHDAESLLSTATVTETGVQLDTARQWSVYERPFSGHYFRMDSGEFRQRSRSLWDEELPAGPTVPVGEYVLYRAEGPGDQSLLIRKSAYSVGGRRIAITVAEDLSPIEEELHEFQLVHAVIALLSLAALLTAQVYAIRRGLLPLKKMQGQVRQLDRGQIKRLAAEAPREIAPLVDEINRLLELTERRLDRSRHALGNLAHALKTPLTLLMRLGDEAKGMDSATRRRLKEETTRIRSLIDRELRRARLAGGPSPGQWFVPEEDIPDLLRVIQGIYADRELTLQPHVAAGRFPVDREDMLELAGNLLDNAAKWARSRIRITVEIAQEITLTVEDDGPGCPAPEHLIQRGRRLDESKAGTGLGLSIVQAVVQDYHGTLELDRSPDLGGLRATVRLPGVVRYDGV